MLNLSSPRRCTAFWRRKSLDISDKKLCFADRFISWDKFKEEYFALNQRGIPANRTMRNLFTVSLLEENKKKGFFKYIILRDTRKIQEPSKNLLFLFYRNFRDL